MTRASGDWRFVEASTLRSGSPDGLDLRPLVDTARAEGFGFLDRLLAEWRSGANRLDGDGERLVAACRRGSIAGVGGLNRDPYAGARTGRLRHLYVAPNQRRLGVGRALVGHLLACAPAAFDRVRLRTGDAGSARFYEVLGFRSCNERDASHLIDLDPAPRAEVTAVLRQTGGCGP